jgi:hypothetical protein
MTPRRADLFDVVEGQNLGVEVVDGHVIKCSVTGKIQLQMMDDNGHVLEAVADAYFRSLGLPNTDILPLYSMAAPHSVLGRRNHP